MRIRIIVAAAFLSILILNILPIEVGDFWWHLATGKWIIEKGTLPDSDPFSYTSGDLRDDKRLILKGYWLAQIIMFLFYKATGFTGIIIARTFLFAAIFYILYRILRYYGLDPGLSLLLVLLILPGIRAYVEARPAVVSFLFSLSLFFVLERMRTDEHAWRDWRLMALPPLIMIIWANMHGGYIMGIGIMVLFLATEGIKSFSRGVDRRYVIIAAILLLSMLISGLNPGGFGYLTRINPIEWVVSSEGARMASVASTHEFLNPLMYYKLTGDWQYLYTFCLVIFITPAAFLLNARRLNLFHLSLAVAFSVAALGSFRFGVFLFLFGVLFTGYNIHSIAGTMQSRRAQYITWALTACTIVAVITNGAPKVRLGLYDGYIPDKAIKFITQSGLPLELFAPYEWGGYLIWATYPRYRTFVDGRTMNDDAYLEYNRIIRGEPGTDDLLDSYNVNTILTFLIKPHNRVVPGLTFHLLKSDKWAPVNWDRKSLVFVRTEMAETPIPKHTIWKALTAMAQSNTVNRAQDPEAYALLGEIYYRQGLNSYAKESFSRALQLDPANYKALQHMKILMGW